MKHHTDYRLLITDYWLLDTDYMILITGYWLLDTDYWILFCYIIYIMLNNN